MLCLLYCCLSVCLFNFNHCVVSLISIYLFDFPSGIFRLSFKHKIILNFHLQAFYDKWAMDTSIGRGYLSGTLYYGRYPTHQEVFQDYNLVCQCDIYRLSLIISTKLIFSLKSVRRR